MTRGSTDMLLAHNIGQKTELDLAPDVKTRAVNSGVPLRKRVQEYMTVQAMPVYIQ